MYCNREQLCNDGKIPDTLGSTLQASSFKFQEWTSSLLSAVTETFEPDQWRQSTHLKVHMHDDQ